ncbi:MAG: MoaD/ThiS family protein [Thermoplasmata archaeon]
MTAPLRVRLFAQAREAAGSPTISWTVPTEGETAAAVLEAIAALHPRLRRVVAHSRILVNGQYADPARTTVRPGDELAIHPPYSGG